MTRNDAIDAHGGTFVTRLVDGSDRERLQERASSMARVRLGDHALRDLEMIAVGAYSPLRGFLGSADHRSVVESMRLADGTLWPLPICLQVKREVAERLKEGTQIALTDERDHVLAVMDLAEMFTPDREVECAKVFGSTERVHPGVARVLDGADVYLGGEINVIERPTTSAFAEHHRDPAATRALFRERGWRTIVAFPTHAPMLRAQEHVTKCALEVVDGLLVHPFVGKARADEIPADVRMRCYEALLSGYYPKDRVLLSVYAGSPHHTGARETLMSAITRQNFGCTHFIVAREPIAGGPADRATERVLSELAPGELGIAVLTFEPAFYSTIAGQMATAKTAPPAGADAQLALSPAKLRDLLRLGQLLPPDLCRPEVARILADSMRMPHATA